MFRVSLQITKYHGGKAFLDVRAAFTLGEGKVVFKFVSLDQNNKRAKEVDCYLSIEEFEFLTKMLVSGQIYTFLDRNSQYISYGGTSDQSGTISRQLKINQQVTKSIVKQKNAQGIEVEREVITDRHLYIKGLQGIGKKNATGGYSPCYTDSTAAINISIKFDAFAVKKLGYAFERALKYYDEWNIQGVLDARCDALRQKEQEAASKNGAANQRNYQQRAVTQPSYQQSTSYAPQPSYQQGAVAYSQPVYSQQAYN